MLQFALDPMCDLALDFGIVNVERISAIRLPATVLDHSELVTPTAAN